MVQQDRYPFFQQPMQTFIVINADVMTQLNPLQILRFHCDHNADATLCVRNYSVEVPFGVVKTENDIQLLL